ncbi:serine hydrolase [Deinococcus psychrotolerans]|uniref:Serine hydrolase n=1 Tax=Deinococcus psychrotolerans TaxID=2489213 RepID=A0A3G8YE81_9DEIO|nr:serine hydrolase [Deinococcus psychrotolerans]AZI42537.1 serine hydrolase [Deinococcus psychrotolerans]
MNKLLLTALLGLTFGSVTLAQTTTAQTAAPATSAAALTPQAALTRLAAAEKVEAGWFTPDFASALPQVAGGFRSFKEQYGAFQSVDDLGSNRYRLRYVGGTVTVETQLNAAGQFTSLFLRGQQANTAPTSATPAQPSPTTPTTPPTSAAPTSNAAVTVQAALTRLLSAKTLSPEWFSADFLKQVPVTQLSPILASASSGLGTFQSVEAGKDGGFTAKFTEGTLPIKGASVDAQGRFTGLLLGAGTPNQKPNLAEAISAFGKLTGQNSVVVVENGKVTGSLSPDQKLAVGSAFKLGIMAELLAQMKTGQHQWSEVTTVQAQDKALPSGFLQTWPDNAPLTLQSLATLMISQSDNTATNVLLRLVGRVGVAKRLGQAALPNTREFFALKNPVNKALLDAYLSGNDAQKKAVLEQAAAAPLPSVSLFAADAITSPQVEWFVPVTTLCGLMNEVAALPLMQVEAGVADPSLFKTVSYKGGSEGGVLNLTTQVTTQDGRTVCVSATSNDSKSIDQTAFAGSYSKVLQAVR